MTLAPSEQLYETTKTKIYENAPSQEELGQVTQAVYAAIDNEECMKRIWCETGSIFRKYKHSDRVLT